MREDIRLRLPLGQHANLTAEEIRVGQINDALRAVQNQLRLLAANAGGIKVETAHCAARELNRRSQKCFGRDGI